MNRQGGSILLLMVGALLLAAPLIIQEVRLGENRRMLQEWNSQVSQEGSAPQGQGDFGPAGKLSPIEALRAEGRLGRRGPVLTEEPEPVPPTPLASDRALESVAAVPAQAVRGAGFRIQLPSLGLDWAVMGDIGNAELAAGPGQYPGTALPGAGGNLAIAGHRTHRGQPSYFYQLNRLAPGDSVIIQSGERSWVYQVERIFVTSAYDRSVLDPTTDSALTLTTCDPPGTEDRRLIVRAKLLSST